MKIERHRLGGKQQFPAVRRGRFTFPFDHYIAIGERLRKDDETSLVTKECTYRGRKVRFVLWLPTSVWLHGTTDVWIPPFSALAILLIALVFVWGIPLWILVGLGLLGAWISFQYASRRGAKRMRVWQNLTGFLVLDHDDRPIRRLEDYESYFRAFATWEEAFLRPVVTQKYSKELLEQRSKTLRLFVRLARQAKFPEPQTELDRQVKRMHEVLTWSEERLTPLLDLEERQKGLIQNEYLRISEDMLLHCNELVGRLKSLRDSEGQIEKLLLERAQAYDDWLAFLQGKGLNLRYTHKGAALTIFLATISAAITRNPSPFASISLPFVRYLADQLGGVRGLRRAARIRAHLVEAIELCLPKLTPTYAAGLSRLPPA